MEKDHQHKTLGSILHSFMAVLIYSILIYWIIEWFISEFKKIFIEKNYSRLFLHIILWGMVYFILSQEKTI